MHSYSMLSKIGIIFIFLTMMACNQLKEKATSPAVVELEIVDSDLAQQFSDGPEHKVIGSMSLEIQQDLTSGKTMAYAVATFHEPIAKNVLFDQVGTNALGKNNYKPKPAPVDQPCGIPGFPDCAKPNPPPVAVPDQPPCGIPGFPDCAANQLTSMNNEIPQEEQ